MVVMARISSRRARAMWERRLFSSGALTTGMGGGVYTIYCGAGGGTKYVACGKGAGDI